MKSIMGLLYFMLYGNQSTQASYSRVNNNAARIYAELKKQHDTSKLLLESTPTKEVILVESIIAPTNEQVDARSASPNFASIPFDNAEKNKILSEKCQLDSGKWPLAVRMTPTVKIVRMQVEQSRFTKK